MAHTLLLADDSVTIQRVIELTFADEDIHVVAVSDGDQALAAMNERPPDIVLLDAVMPGRSGYEVMEYMRGTPPLMDVPVLLLAGAIEPIDQARADAARCSGVLVKPFEPQQVISRVQELLTRPPGARPDSSVSNAAVAPLAKTQANSASVDEYFSRLDQAFAGVSGYQDPVMAGVDVLPVRPDGMVTERSCGGSTAAQPDEQRKGEASLAAAFFALLDAERAGIDPSSARLLATPSETFIDEVAERVLERISTRMGSEGREGRKGQEEQDG